MNLAVLDPAVMEKTAAMLKPDAVQTYMKTLAGRMAALQAALRAAGDPPAEPARLTQAAHALAGSAGMFGFERLVLVARHFERTVKADPSQAATLGADLDAVLDLSLAALRARSGEVEQAEAA